MVLLAAEAVSASPPEVTAAVPLVVDLDDTLLRTDSLLETLFLFIRRHPLRALELPLQLLQGRAVLKQFLAERALPDLAALPYRDGLVAYLKAEKLRGRRIVLATGADQAVARGVADQLGVFDEVLASDGVNNLTGERKRARLVAQFSEKGFDYIGDGRREDAVWRSAREAQLVGAFDRHPIRWSACFQAMRPHHWLKNLLLFLPLFTAHLLDDPRRVRAACIAFVAFSACASSIYLLNDLLDLPFDRAHPQKKQRALAAGQMRLAHAVVLALASIAAAASLALLLPPAFAAVLAIYFSLMVGYSLRWKDVPIVDVLILACGYAVRVVAGAIVVGVAPSPWLLAFCVTLFTSLALIKRYTELLTMERFSRPHTAHARGYLPEDRTLIAAQGIASGYLAALILPLYAVLTLTPRSSERSALFWLLSLLLFYWINYMWLVAHRGRMHHDPLAFALSDPTSRTILVAATIAGLFAA